jgi:ascorbate-specific PTS system EIIC-type component UlaA
MSRQLYMLGFLLLVAGGFMLVSDWWHYWGEFAFLIGLFVGVLGVVVAEEKTKIMAKALGTSLLVAFAFKIIGVGIDRLVWYPYRAPFIITQSTLSFFCMLITVLTYIMFNRMEKQRLSSSP